MCRYACALLPVIFQFIFVREVSSTLCMKEELFERTHFICPRFHDPRDKTYCCGPKKSPYCCSYAEYEFPFFEEDLETEDFPAREGNYSFSATIGTTAIGIIVFVLVTFVVVVIIVGLSCFCCNGCILAQHRNRQGNTTNTANQPATTTTTATAHYSAQPPYPMQTFRTSVYQQQHPEKQSFNPAAISSSQEHFQNSPNTPTAPISRPIGWFVSRRPPPSPPYPINDQPP